MLRACFEFLVAPFEYGFLSILIAVSVDLAFGLLLTDRLSKVAGVRNDRSASLHSGTATEEAS